MEDRDLKKRTKVFAIRIIKLVEYLEKHGSIAAKILGDRQLLRSGTGVAAAYRAACRSKSRNDFISKMGTAEEEADETQLWLELFLESRLVDSNLIKDLLHEAGELAAIMTKSRNTAIKNKEQQ